METKQNNSQHFYAKYLNRNDIASQITVVGDSFQPTGCRGHLDKLKDWQEFVVEEGFSTVSIPSKISR